MTSNFCNRYGKPIYEVGCTYDLPDGYAEFLKKNGYAKDDYDNKNK